MYALRTGDIVSVQVFGEPDLSAESVTVDEGGRIALPLVGEVDAAGATAAGLTNRIETLLTALAQAQSPTEVAAIDQVVVFRNRDGQRLGGMFDLRAIRAGRMPDLALLPGDVVVVGHSARRAALRGLFRATPILGAFGPL